MRAFWNPKIAYGPTLALLFCGQAHASEGGAATARPGGSRLPEWLRPSPPAAAPKAPSYRLVPGPGGVLLHEAERFTAIVSPDGQVTFRPVRARSSLHLLPPVPSNPYFTTAHLGWLRWRHWKAIEGKTPRSPLSLLDPPPPAVRRSPYHYVPNADTCFLPDGTNVCETCEGGTDSSGANQLRWGGTTGGFCALNIVSHLTIDLNDAYLRALGADPLAREKAAFLAATFELRVGMAARWGAEALRQGELELPPTLERLWSDPQAPPSERRRILFELWLETDRPAARAAIAAFIHRKLGPGSPDGYTTEELERLRKRTGAAGFLIEDGAGSAP